MALTPFRWISLAAIGCMLVVLALVSVTKQDDQADRFQRFSTSGDIEEVRLRERAGELNRAVQNLAARYRLLYVLDSTTRSVSQAPDTGAMRLFIADAYAPDLRATIETRIRNARSIRRGDVGRVDIFVVSDTPRSIRGVNRYLPATEVRYQLPERAGERCLVFVRTFSMADARKAFELEKAPQHLLGPCGFYSAFGEPGPLVNQWLSSGAWQYSIEGSWTTGSVIPEVGEDRGIFKGPAPAAALLNVETGGPACIKGDLDTCERLLTLPARRRPAAQVGRSTYALSLGRRRFFAGGIGYQAGELLSDAVRELGRDRFKEFWTSPDSVPAAFQKVAGERWGAFIQRWMIAHYGQIHPGPRMSPFALVTSTILVLVALGATMLMSVKRAYV